MPIERMWIAFGDIHEDISKIDGLPLKSSQGVIITGDITNCGGKSTAKTILNQVAMRLFMAEDISADDPVPLQLFAQIGNMDLPEVTEYLEELGANIHGKVVQLSETAALVGIGGSNKTPFQTPSEFFEADYEEFLMVARKHLESLGIVHILLVSHTPPMDTACDRIGAGVHVGSTAVRDFIEAMQPDVCLCGHIHEAVACDNIGRTQIVNAGAFSEGGYVKVRLVEGEGFSAELCKG